MEMKQDLTEEELKSMNAEIERELLEKMESSVNRLQKVGKGGMFELQLRS